MFFFGVFCVFAYARVRVRVRVRVRAMYARILQRLGIGTARKQQAV